jgi:uncharacterized repeat protein (TIGR01451 family)
LTACGGGGGGDGGSAGGSAPVPLTYVGNTNPAIVTTSNAAAITANVVSSGDSSSAIPTSSLSATPAVAQEDGMIDLGRRLHRSVRGSLTQPSRASASRQATLAIAIDERLDCDSGSGRTFGTVNDNGTGTVSIQYNACRIDGTTLTGSATMRIDAFDPFFGFTDFTISYTRLTLSGSVAADLTGSVRSRLDIPTRSETITENVVVLFPSGIMTKSENLVYVDVYNDLFSPTSYTESVSGRVFHSVHGWVDITTPVPLFFGTLTQSFPQNGQLVLTGAGGAGIWVTAFSTTLLSLALDINGDGLVERTAMLSWTDLSGPVGANLGDDDVDGMHNGWETANGFDPDDASDALVDADSDGSTNLAEYQAGTNPRNQGSTPPVVGLVGLSIQASDSPDPAVVGGSLTYTLTVSNSSSFAAIGVLVTDTLPASVNLVSATAGQGSCTGTVLVSCNLGTINGFGITVVTIVVTPTGQGLISNTATVSTGSLDPVTSDNSVTSVTLVGLPAAGIQGRIDTASPGDMIIVDPGNYAGPLNFHGKNVTLRSRDGPATTIIHGNGGTGEPVIQMGPGGALIGFTISGGSASFGAGIHILGATGSLISGNIFDGNRQGAGGYGAAIGGNSASATIERNVFRNNSCDSQFISGVVAFINQSSPRIVNNVFVNNPCRGINMTMPESNTPEIINNTFVGNRAAIRVDRRVSQASQVYRNNVIVQNGIGLEIEFGVDAGNPLWTNNLVFGNTTDYSGTASLTGANGNISADPLFVDPAAGDYDLQPRSPAIGAGTSTNAPATDFDGLARVGSIDIGAFEGP